MVWTLGLALALLQTVPDASPTLQAITLVCAGAGSNRNGDFQDTVTIEISGASARLRVPAALIPPVHGGGDDGWWPIQNFRTTDTDITGTFSLNFADRPTLHISRNTGLITISTHHTNFSGSCEKADPAARKF